MEQSTFPKHSIRQQKNHWFLYLFVGIWLAPLCAQAQVSDVTPNKQEILQSMSWRNIGPNRGGRSLGIAGSTKRKNEYYFGAVGGGLWKTIDGGLTWKPVTDGQINSSSVGAVAVSESNPDMVYIGTGEVQFRGNIMQGDGIYKSADAGKTWQHVGLKNSQAIARIRIHPTNPDIVYTAVLGHPFGPNEERGVFKTTDGGKTWKKVLYKGDKAGAVDLVIDVNNPETLYATIWQVYRTPYKMWGGGGASGIFKSTDGGESWEELTRKPGLPTGTVGKIGVAVSPVDSKRVWAVVEAEDGGVYRSDDAGATWQLVNNERKLRQRAFYYSRLVADPLDRDGVYGLNVGFYKSSDGGVTFDKTIRVPHGDNHDLWIAADDSNRLAEANDGGGTISLNGGDTWTDEDFPTAQLYHIMVTSDFPYHVAGAQQDNTTIAVPSDDWSHMSTRTNSIKSGLGYAYSVGGGESGYIAQDPKDPDIFYAGSQGALLTRINRSTGQIRDVQVYPRFFSGEEAKVLPERWQWTFPIVFSPKNPNKLYTCSQHVWVSSNEGQSWDKISPDLTYADTTTLGISGGEITRDMNGPEIYATVFALAPSHHDEQVIWAGSDDGLIHITRDHGKNWTNITPPDMVQNTRVSIIEESPHHPGTAYVAAKRYQMDDRAPYIWKTKDYGKTWTKIVQGIGEDDYVHSIREDLVVPGLLYAGTEHGVWVSYNDGAQWLPLQFDLPDTQVSDLIVTEKDLVIGTHGRSIYILDDIAPLRQLATVNLEEPHLFNTYPAVRRIEEGLIQYYLPKVPQTLRVEIFNAQGDTVIAYQGTPDETGQEDTGGRYAVQQMPSMKAGLNNFQWNLRYPGATSFDGMIIWSGRPQLGPFAPPGEYQVKLTVDGETFTEQLQIKLDPRLKGVSEADVMEQFKLAIDLRNKTSLANEAVIKIRKMKAAMEANKEKHRKMLDQLSSIEEALYQVRNQSAQDPLNFPIKLNNRLASLWRSVETGDAKPTAGAYQVTEELTEELNTYLSQLDTLFSSKEIKPYLKTLDL
ncbi:glycosyl hydrolase [Olivibacter sp. SDN3]|uniref:WD40/YVTN/BNR-like repeat-containing protein n=1 Tax=Olivibacter sp. SDN3 TaxID=2764720 RepID=UPI0016515530|nr:sialidase family protein [Olivibacter sp. SDN3]QNL52013.1 glycosyl hydrolase [Olivibacter sp. SDN3]